MVSPRWLRSMVPTVLATALLFGCGGKSETPPPAAGAAVAATSELTPFQQEHGIGPVTEELKLGAIDEEMAEEGKVLFESKCSACHKMADRYVGPPLGDVTTRRSAAYLMNMILNPDGMYAKHPAARQLLAEYMTQMPNLALTQEQARQIVEYLRTQAPK